jgi:hypothetical protein
VTAQARRVRRLLRWYPRSWRDRYGAATGWQRAATGPHSAAAATLIMVAAAVVLGILGLAAAVPVGWLAVSAASRDRGRHLRGPAALAVAGAIVLTGGARHFAHGWPGTGGGGAEHTLVPGGLAAFGWASTLSVSAYWAHPRLWGLFPTSELTWMMLSPLAWAGLITGCVLVVRRLGLTVRLLRYLAALAAAATGPAVGFLAGAAMWVLASGPGQAAAFRPGLVDAVSLLIMATATAIALRAAVGIRRARIRLARA